MALALRGPVSFTHTSITHGTMSESVEPQLGPAPVCLVRLGMARAIAVGRLRMPNSVGMAEQWRRIAPAAPMDSKGLAPSEVPNGAWVRPAQPSWTRAGGIARLTRLHAFRNRGTAQRSEEAYWSRRSDSFPCASAVARGESRTWDAVVVAQDETTNCWQLVTLPPIPSHLAGLISKGVG